MIVNPVHGAPAPGRVLPRAPPQPRPPQQGTGVRFLLRDCKAKAFVKGMFCFHRHRHPFNRELEYRIPGLHSPVNSRRFPEIPVRTKQYSCGVFVESRFLPFSPACFRRRPEPVYLVPQELSYSSRRRTTGESNATCLMRPHLFHALFVLSRITIVCQIIRHF